MSEPHIPIEASGQPERPDSPQTSQVAHFTDHSLRRTKEPAKFVIAKTTLSGMDVVRLMRKHGKTIRSLAFRMGVSQNRVRQVRKIGLTKRWSVQEWLEAITGEDHSPIPEKYRINQRSEEGDCGSCGYPMGVGDETYGYVGEVFCSITCCRKRRGW